MIYFSNDYSEGAHPVVIEALVKYNMEQNVGYGLDKHSERAKDYIKEHIGRKDVDIHFIPGGTQTNMLVISSFLRPHQGVISAHTGHVNVHETGAIEASGHKVIAINCEDGKLTPSHIKQVIEMHTDEHMVQPKMVYISDSTEVGTIYTKAELEAIHQICRERGLLLFLDGARMASALTSKDNDMTLKDIAQLVDVFYIGGTKNGALLGEALIICNESLKEDFRFLIKQKGAMMAKGFVMGIQFEALFKDDLFLKLGAHANHMAEQIAASLQQHGYPFTIRPSTNQLFPILPNQLLGKLSERFTFSLPEFIDQDHSSVRIVTSWATTQEDVNELIEALSSDH